MSQNYEIFPIQLINKKAKISFSKKKSLSERNSSNFTKNLLKQLLFN